MASNPERKSKAKATRISRLAAGAILLADAGARKAITGAVHRNIASTASDADHSQGRHAATLGLIVLGAKAMAADVRDAILDARQESRAASQRRLVAELAAAGVVIEEHQRAVADRSGEDEAH